MRALFLLRWTEMCKCAIEGTENRRRWLLSSSSKIKRWLRAVYAPGSVLSHMKAFIHRCASTPRPASAYNKYLEQRGRECLAPVRRLRGDQMKLNSPERRPDQANLSDCLLEPLMPVSSQFSDGLSSCKLLNHCSCRDPLHEVANCPLGANHPLCKSLALLYFDALKID